MTPPLWLPWLLWACSCGTSKINSFQPSKLGFILLFFFHFLNSSAASLSAASLMQFTFTSTYKFTYNDTEPKEDDNASEGDFQYWNFLLVGSIVAVKPAKCPKDLICLINIEANDCIYELWYEGI